MEFDDDMHKYMERLYGWVGPGSPDLDDEYERQRFMAAVMDAAYHYQYQRWKEQGLLGGLG